mgnify:CR=1 FL=1
MYCARSSSSQSYEGVYLYKVYYYRNVYIHIPSPKGMRADNDEGIRDMLMILNDLVKTKKDMKRLNQAIDTLENPLAWWVFRFHP